MSSKTALCIVNFSGRDIINIDVTNQTGFEKSATDPSGFVLAPTHFLQGKGIVRNASRCGYVEIESSPSNFTLELTFDDGRNLPERAMMVGHWTCLRHFMCTHTEGED